MNKMKKIITIFMALVIGFSSFLFNSVNASADIDIKEDNEDKLEVVVSSIKEEYRFSETGKISVNVKNNYNFVLDRIMISVYSDDCKLPANTRSKSDIISLKADEAYTFTVEAVLGSGNDLNFFQRILFFFRSIFTRSSYDSFERLNSDDKENVSLDGKNVFEKKNSINVKYGAAECKFEISVIYDCGYSTKMKEKADEFNKTVKDLMYSDDFKKSDNIQKQDLIKKKLAEDIAGEIKYDEEENTMWFERKSGDSDINETEIVGIELSDDSNEQEYALPDSGDNIPINAPFLILDGFSTTDFDKKGQYYEMKEEYNKYYVSKIAKPYYQQCRNLNGSSLLSFSCHGKICEILNCPCICLVDYPDTDAKFQADLKAKNAATLFRYNPADDIAKIFGILLPSFFSDKDFTNTVVFLESCYAFGNSKEDKSLANVLIEKNCKAVIGFQNRVDNKYCKDFMRIFFERFASGDTVKNAVEYCRKALEETKLKNNDNSIVNIVGDKNATILDCGPNGGALIGLKITLVDNEFNLKDSKLFLFSEDIVIDDVLVNEKAYLLGQWKSCKKYDKISYEGKIYSATVTVE